MASFIRNAVFLVAFGLAFGPYAMAGAGLAFLGGVVLQLRAEARR